MYIPNKEYYLSEYSHAYRGIVEEVESYPFEYSSIGRAPNLLEHICVGLEQNPFAHSRGGQVRTLLAHSSKYRDRSV